jgi:hypothetical protein
VGVRRISLIIFHIAAAISLVVSVWALVAWPWSYFRGHKIGRDDLKGFISMSVARGELCVCTVHYLEPPALHTSWELGWFSQDATDLDPIASVNWYVPGSHPPVAGFFLGRGANQDGRTTMMMVPLPFAVSLMAVLPALAMTRHVRRQRRGHRIASGCCAACGYDLRASPQRCPECGAVPRLLTNV